MPNLIIFEEKEVPALGLNREKKPDIEKMKEYFFDDELEMLQGLQTIEHTFSATEVSLLYPGCGTDILTPLLYLERIMPRIERVKLHFVDTSGSFAMFKTILYEVGISFAECEGGIQFHWQHILVTLYFHQQNIARFLHNCPEYHIYFEKCFRIMKDRMPEYEQVVFDRLATSGLVISDSGFLDVGLEKIEVDLKLSAYGEMMVGRKR
ncbi:MAG: hypothetical protein A3D39_01650 [Candidatus Buchananbacteria bacterium RIFCSPHIGHO2_02_FULL_39_17]|nr:MAG: hypothetical protein A3D39_01650 [Candidatus Buchananbacteria bacterium RIFCSPHIGHO2_02_FULL_39_17]